MASQHVKRTTTNHRTSIGNSPNSKPKNKSSTKKPYRGQGR